MVDAPHLGTIADSKLIMSSRTLTSRMTYSTFTPVSDVK